MQQKFSEKFAQAWAKPSPEMLVALLHPDVMLYQPHRPAIRGRQAAIKEFQRLFAWLPKLYGETDRTVEQGEWVFIE